MSAGTVIRRSTPKVTVPARTVRVGAVVVGRSGDPVEVTPAVRRVLRRVPDAPVLVYVVDRG
jgi:hypothetical protein